MKPKEPDEMRMPADKFDEMMRAALGTPAPAPDEASKSITGKQLNEEWAVGARHALYRKDGTWYHLLERFPGALFDAHGYVVFQTKSDLINCPGVVVGEARNWVNFPAGIAELPGYVRRVSF